MPEYSTFRKTSWDPVIILSQIATVQCFGYSTFSFVMVVASMLTGIQLSPRLLFESRLVRGDTVEGWTIGLGLVSMGVANILPLVYMVERSRLCIDFSMTFFAVHLILVWWHQGSPPTTLLWWLVIGVSGAIMAFVGRAACLRREMLPIAIRSFMPNHPSERQQLSGGDVGVEEHELESRYPENAHRDTPEIAPNSIRRGSAERDAEDVEILFDNSQLDDNEDNFNTKNSIPNAGAIPTKKALAKPSDPAKLPAGAKPDTIDDDEWEVDSWGEDDVDDIDETDVGADQNKTTSSDIPNNKPTIGNATQNSGASSRATTPLTPRFKGSKDD